MTCNLNLDLPVFTINLFLSQLAKSLNLEKNPNLAKIELPTKDESSHVGDLATISGYGYTRIDLVRDPLTGQRKERNGRSDNKLKFAKIKIIGNEECARKNYYQTVVKSHICGHALQRRGELEGICSVSLAICTVINGVA